MKKTNWKLKIRKDMDAVGTYKESFQTVIDTLADILERRDRAIAQWKEEGCKLMVEKVSDRGAVNVAKNPLLALIQECERDALTYWSQLGLTPSGLKKTLNETSVNVKGGNGLGDILKAIAEET